MIDPTLIPTRLVSPAERPPVEIVTAVPEPGFPAAHTLYRLLSWVLQGLWLRMIGKGDRLAQGQRLRRLFDELGGFWIKAGQLMALRVDLFSPELCQELSTLQDRANGFSFDIARRIVEHDLAVPLSHVFDAFEEMPFAAASIGQTHKAHLKREDVWVAVKVQRPYVARAVANELALIRRITRFMDALSIQSHVRWSDFYWELQHILEEEVDFRFEASNLRRMRKTLRRHNIFVPRAFDQYSSRNVLVMEFVEGALMADYLRLIKTDPARLSSWLIENNIEPDLLARRLCLSMMRQVLEDNLYHGDLHPGNIILLRDSRFALIDFGTVGFLDREFLDKYRLCLKSLALLDYEKAVDLLFLLSAMLPIKDLDRAKEELVRSLRAWGARTSVKQLPYSEKSVDNVWVELGQIYHRYKCTFSWEFLRIRRTFATLDASLMVLYPEANYTALLGQYFRQAGRRTLRQITTRKSLRELMMKVVLTSRDTPEKIAEMTFFGASLARKQAKVFEGATSKVANLFAVLFGNLSLLCALAGVGIILILLDRHAPAMVQPLMKGIIYRSVHAAPPLETGTWLLLLAFDIYLGWTFAKLRRRFRRTESALPGMRPPRE
jgi:ubiquinone biosynthesis protein